MEEMIDVIVLQLETHLKTDVSILLEKLQVVFARLEYLEDENKELKENLNDLKMENTGLNYDIVTLQKRLEYLDL